MSPDRWGDSVRQVADSEELCSQVIGPICSAVHVVFVLVEDDISRAGAGNKQGRNKNTRQWDRRGEKREKMERREKTMAEWWQALSKAEITDQAPDLDTASRTDRRPCNQPSADTSIRNTGNTGGRPCR